MVDELQSIETYYLSFYVVTCVCVCLCIVIIRSLSHYPQIFDGHHRIQRKSENSQFTFTVMRWYRSSSACTRERGRKTYTKNGDLIDSWRFFKNTAAVTTTTTTKSTKKLHTNSRITYEYVPKQVAVTCPSPVTCGRRKWLWRRRRQHQTSILFSFASL